MPFIHMVLYIAFLLTETPTHEVSKKTFDWNTTPNQTWLGNDFWANPLQDWRVENGQIECLVQKHNRNIRLLGYVLDSSANSFSCSVKVGCLTDNLPISNDTFIGWELGCKGEFEHYKDDVVKGKGWRVGISTDGQLFLNGIQKETHIDFTQQTVYFILKGSIDINQRYLLRLEIKDVETQALLGFIEQRNVPSQYLEGHMGFVVDFPKDCFSSAFNERKPSIYLDNFNIYGQKWKEQKEKQFKDVLFAKYTLDNNQLHLSAQLPPIAVSDDFKVFLDIQQNNIWQNIATSLVDQDAKTAVFNIDNWDITRDTPYRIYTNVDAPNYLEGTIKKVPFNTPIKLATISCIGGHAFPYTTAIEHINAHEPDFLFFAGDQIYEFDNLYENANPSTPLDVAVLNYFYKWIQYGWAFQEMLANTPSVLLVDDHDVYQGNLWGNSGISPNKPKSELTPEDGGFNMGKDFVNIVQKTQVSHLPPTASPTTTNGIDNYFGQLDWAGISFAMLEDRKFKSTLPAPSEALVSADDKILTKRFDTDDVQLLGEEQLAFLENWATTWTENTWLKVALSQTIFSQLTTTADRKEQKKPLEINEYVNNRQWYKDFDSNGWPQTGRNKALEILRSCGALHLCGDQHLGITAQYGIQAWKDANFVLSAPALSNVYPRTWYPPERGLNVYRGTAKNIGDFRDGFNNHVTVKAVYNQYPTGREPASWFDKGVGYGIVELIPKEQKVNLAVWSLHQDPNALNAKPCKGWPVRIHRNENLGLKASFNLPQIRSKVEQVVIKVIHESSNELEYVLSFDDPLIDLPKVRQEGFYRIELMSLGDGQTKVFSNIEAASQVVEQVLE